VREIQISVNALNWQLSDMEIEHLKSKSKATPQNPEHK